jgi:ubiquinone/menaquinone biosynthesis C-methylase UbiE
MTKEENPTLNRPKFKDYLQWDIFIWGKALNCWTQILKEQKITQGLALEIGSKDGGLSLYLANEFDFKVICSDIDGPTEKAKELHKKYSADINIEYRKVDVLNLQFENNIFDVVIFKSVLGSIGKNNNFELQQRAINELYRVLKPKGILLFAENAKASFLHSYFRKKFRKWASYWRYVTFNEMIDMLSAFSFQKVHCSGFLSAFFSNHTIKRFFFPLDNILENLISRKFRYVIYGYAIK